MEKEKTPTNIYLINCASDSGVNIFFIMGRVQAHSSIFFINHSLQITIPNEVTIAVTADEVWVHLNQTTMDKTV
jgi:hypothetical protein